MNLSDMVRKMQELGYETDDAEARVCQDIVFDNEGASLLINTREQMFAEKLRSLYGNYNHEKRLKIIF